jgi:probable phosphoglycerate mutase
MKLYLIRHGQSHVNLKTWTNGNTDEGLTTLGQKQAEALAAWLPGEVSDVSTIYSSTMRRARETAGHVARAYEMPIVFDDRLREIGNNRVDHSPWPNDSLPLHFADYWSSERPFAPVTPEVNGGETMMHFRTRVGLFIEEMVQRHADETIIAVCHGGVVDMTFDHVINVGAFRRCEVWDFNTGLSCFEHVAHPQRETWRLHFHNRIDHLRGLEPPAEEEETVSAGEAAA